MRNEKFISFFFLFIMCLLWNNKIALEITANVQTNGYEPSSMRQVYRKEFPCMLRSCSLTSIDTQFSIDKTKIEYKNLHFLSSFFFFLHVSLFLFLSSFFYQNTTSKRIRKIIHVNVYLYASQLANKINLWMLLIWIRPIPTDVILTREILNKYCLFIE